MLGPAARPDKQDTGTPFDGPAQHRDTFRQRPRLARGRGAAARGRARGLPDRDCLWPRRRRPQRSRGGRHLRGQGPAGLQPADRPCRGLRRCRTARDIHDRGGSAGRTLLARSADAGAAAPPGLRPLRARHRGAADRRAARPGASARPPPARGLRWSGRGAVRQSLRAGQRDDGGACPRRARRPDRRNPRRRRLPGRARIDDRRF